jgi:branched-chain amino acid transport system permease protein
LTALLRRVGGAVVVLVVAIAAPQLITGAYYQNLAILALLYAIVAANWDLTIGYAGLFNFAHIAFFGLGAYTSGVLTTKYGISPWLGIAAAVGLCVVVGGAVAFPATRLRGIYVALTTFAFTQLVSSLIVSRTSLTGGSAGLVLIPSITIGSYDFGFHNAGYFYLAEGLLIVSTIFLRVLVRSDFGLSFVAIREFEDYAASRGVPVARQRLLALVISSVFTGAAGAIYAHYLGVASPDIFGFGFVTLFLSMVILGGSGTIYGPIVAAIVLTFFTESRQLAGLGDLRFMLISVLIVLVLLFARGGIWGAVQALGRILSRAGTGHGPIKPLKRQTARDQGGG